MAKRGSRQMELKLYDTFSRTERVFTPLDPAHVRMYVCGPTVYDFAHIGNARPVIVFDLLFRLLNHLAKQGVWDGGKGETTVTYVRNITDVDDKINARAAEEYPDLPLNEAIRQLTEQTEKQFHQDVAALGCLPPTVEPRATEHIEAMKELIERLVSARHAYVAEEHVLFSVASMRGYGWLSWRSLDEMIAGARVEVAPYKRDPMDFVMWKPSKPGEPKWPSPCGIATPGRPGWHIECSAMAWKHLGETFDIHGGGVDLIFPHHENEIAQTRGTFHTPIMANYWVHNGFLEIEGRKMAKSEGNFITIRELLETDKFGGRRWSGDVVRLAMLETPYRQRIDWTVRALEQSEARLRNWRAFAGERTIRRHGRELKNGFFAALCDNLNTHAAFKLIDQACSEGIPNERNRYTVHWILRRLGFTSKKTRAARVVEAIDPILENIAHLSDTSWVQFFDRSRHEISKKPTPETKLLASVQAVGELRRSLQNSLAHDLQESQWKQLFDAVQGSSLVHPKVMNRVFHLAYQPNRTDWNHYPGNQELTQIYAKRLKSTYLQKALSSAISNLAHLTLNDWRNLVENVRSKPFFSSGEPKPETKLFVYLLLFAALQEYIRSLTDDEPEPMRKLTQQIFSKISPKEDEFEREIRTLVDARNAARLAKSFKEADRIRDELKAMGIELEDHKDGTTTWKAKR
jgi:cysteinyl-tRNA synthetase